MIVHDKMIFSSLLLIFIVCNVHQPSLAISSSHTKRANDYGHSSSLSPTSSSSFSSTAASSYSARIKPLTKAQINYIQSSSENHSSQDPSSDETFITSTVSPNQDQAINMRLRHQLIDPELAEEMIMNNAPITSFHSQLIRKQGIASEYSSSAGSGKNKKASAKKHGNSSTKRVMPLVYMSKDHELDKRTDKPETRNDSSSNSSSNSERDRFYDSRKEENFYAREHQRPTNNKNDATDSSVLSSSPILSSSSPTMSSSYFSDHPLLTESVSALDHTDSSPYQSYYDRYFNRDAGKHEANYHYTTTESTLFPVPSISSRSLPIKPVNSSEIDRLVQRLRAQLRPQRLSPEAVTLSTLVSPTSSVSPFVEHLYHGPHQIISSASMTRNQYRPLSAEDGRESADSRPEMDVNSGHNRQISETTTIGYEEAAQNHGPVYLANSDHHTGDVHSDLSESYYPSPSPLTSADFGPTHMLPSPASVTAFSKLNEGMLGSVALSHHPAADHFTPMHALADHAGHDLPYKSPNELIHGDYEDAVKNGDQFRVGPRPGGYQNYYEYGNEIRPAAYGPQNTMKDIMRMVDSVRHVVYKMKPLKGMASKMYRDFTDKMKKRIRSFRGSPGENMIHNGGHYGGPINYGGLGDASSIKPLTVPMSNPDNDPASMLLNEYIQQITGSAINNLQPTPGTSLSSLGLNMPIGGLHSLLGHHQSLPSINTLSTMGGINGGLGQLNGLNGLLRPTVSDSASDTGNDADIDESSLIFQLLSGLKLRRAGSTEEMSEAEFIRQMGKDFENVYLYPMRGKNYRDSSKVFAEESNLTLPASKSTSESRALLTNTTVNPLDVSNVTLRGSSNTDSHQRVEDHESMAQQSEGNSTRSEEKSGFAQFLDEFFEGTAGYDALDYSEKNENKTEVDLEGRKRRRRAVRDRLEFHKPKTSALAHDGDNSKMNDEKKMRIISKKKVMAHELGPEDEGLKKEKFKKLQSNGSNLTSSSPMSKHFAKRDSFIFGSRLNRPWKEDAFTSRQIANKSALSSRSAKAYRGLPITLSTSSSVAASSTTSNPSSSSPLETGFRTWKSSLKTNLTEKLANLHFPSISKLKSMVSKPLKDSKYFKVSNAKDIKKLYEKMLVNGIKGKASDGRETSLANFKFPALKSHVNKPAPLTVRSASTLNPMQSVRLKQASPRARPVVGVFVADLDDYEKRRPHHIHDFEETESGRGPETSDENGKVQLKIFQIQNGPAAEDGDGDKYENDDNGNSNESDGKVYRLKSKKIKVNHRPLVLKQDSQPSTSATKSAFLVPNDRETLLTLPTLSPDIIHAMKKTRLYFVPPSTSTSTTTTTESPLIEEITSDYKPYIFLLVDKKPSILPTITSSLSDAAEFGGIKRKQFSTRIAAGLMKNNHDLNRLKIHGYSEQLHNAEFNYPHSLDHFPLFTDNLLSYPTLYPTSSFLGTPEIGFEIPGSLINGRNYNNTTIQRHGQRLGKPHLNHYNNIIDPITLRPKGSQQFADFGGNFQVEPTQLYNQLDFSSIAPHLYNQARTTSRTTGPWIPRNS